MKTVEAAYNEYYDWLVQNEEVDIKSRQGIVAGIVTEFNLDPEDCAQFCVQAHVPMLRLAEVSEAKIAQIYQNGRCVAKKIAKKIEIRNNHADEAKQRLEDYPLGVTVITTDDEWTTFDVDTRGLGNSAITNALSGLDWGFAPHSEAGYSGDPRWIDVRYPTTCSKCGRSIQKGEKAFYYPNGKQFYCDHDDCGGQASRDFGANVFDEDFGGSYGAVGPHGPQPGSGGSNYQLLEGSEDVEGPEIEEGSLGVGQPIVEPTPSQQRTVASWPGHPSTDPGRDILDDYTPDMQRGYPEDSGLSEKQQEIEDAAGGIVWLLDTKGEITMDEAGQQVDSTYSTEITLEDVLAFGEGKLWTSDGQTLKKAAKIAQSQDWEMSGPPDDEDIVSLTNAVSLPGNMGIPDKDDTEAERMGIEEAGVGGDWTNKTRLWSSKQAQRDESMPKVMDRETAEHFYNWLESTVHMDDQHEVEELIHKLLKDHPDLVETRSWPEMRELAERNYSLGAKKTAQQAVAFEDTEIDTWFERDRASVVLRDKATQQETYAEWWDEDVQGDVDAGYLDPNDWHGSAYRTAVERGLIREAAKTAQDDDNDPKEGPIPEIESDEWEYRDMKWPGDTEEDIEPPAPSDGFFYESSKTAEDDNEYITEDEKYRMEQEQFGNDFDFIDTEQTRKEMDDPGAWEGIDRMGTNDKQDAREDLHNVKWDEYDQLQSQRPWINEEEYSNRRSDWEKRHDVSAAVTTSEVVSVPTTNADEAMQRLNIMSPQVVSEENGYTLIEVEALPQDVQTALQGLEWSYAIG